MKTCFSLILTPLACLLVSCGTQEEAFDATGAFEATEVIVSSEASGRILAFDIREGSRLEAGACVGYVDTTQLYLRKMQLAAGLRAIDIRKPDVHKQIAATAQQIATARTEQQRLENLVRAGAANRKQLDDIVSLIHLLEKQLDAQRSSLDKTATSAEAEAESLYYQLLQLDDQLQKCRITNPFQGVVLAKYAEAGEVTAPAKPLYKIADTDRLYLRAYITAAQLDGLQLGQTVKVYAGYGQADDSRTYDGSLAWISDKAEFTPKGIQTRDERSNLVYAIRIAVHNDGYLKIGQYGEVKF
ncbi:MAG: HlyD family efflux transporter periplasmic adaptor subunit [Tannerellaceae bacterium]|jgi:HlyD family secretion protein|nr:HlyD family efflux transporter periplasmic adaptor subunit [Tannerellaceae bacterium]